MIGLFNFPLRQQPDGTLVSSGPISAPAIKTDALAYVIDASQYTRAEIQAQIDAFSEYFGIMIPFGYTLVCDEPLVISHKKYVKIFGGGVIQGTVKVGAYIYGDPVPALDVQFEGVHFDSGRLVWEDGVSNGLNAIELDSVDCAKIDGCSFRGYDTCVYLSIEQNYEGITRHATRTQITRCTTARDAQPNTAAGRRITYPNYFVRQADNGLNGYRAADIIITNNEALSSICNIWLYGIDGATITDNIFFMPSFYDRSQIKTNNIYINAVQWTVISDNKLFEAGLESIRINKFADLNISDNVIAWPGQKAERYAIKVSGGKNLGSTTGDTNCASIISANKMGRGSGGGIRVDAGCDYVHVFGNIGDYLGSTETYYGDGTQAAGASAVPALVGPAYGVSIAPTCYGCSAYLNNYGASQYDLPPSTIDPGNRGNGLHFAGPHHDRNIGIYGEEKKIITVNNPSGALDCQQADMVLLTGTGGTITAITGVRYNRRTIILNFASRCIVKHVGGTSISLVGGVDAVMPYSGRLEIIKGHSTSDPTAQRVYEVGRSFDAPKVSSTITATTRLYSGAQELVILSGPTAGQTLNLDDNYGTKQPCRIRNRSTQTWTIAPQAGKTINGAASITLEAGASIDLYDDTTTAWVG